MDKIFTNEAILLLINLFIVIIQFYIRVEIRRLEDVLNEKIKNIETTIEILKELVQKR
ncbi:hypothetical protein [Caldisericum sp.]|uniref:hypothetical protein n=1 Tax=Caldisericum sp. TaxID=2499687 RepID=UPI003D0D8993